MKTPNEYHGEDATEPVKPKAICPECGAECEHSSTLKYKVPLLNCKCGFFAAKWDSDNPKLKYNLALELGRKTEEKKDESKNRNIR